MTLLKPLLLATMLSIASNAAKTDCPLGWLPNTFHETKCCSGNMVIDEQGAYCCVNDMRAYKELLTNTALLYATSTTTEETNWSTVDNSCFAEVRFTATDYSAQVSSASSKAEATPTNDSTSKATSTSTTTSGATAGTGSQTSTSSPTSSPTPTSNAAMPLATADVLGGAAFAAALFML
ncbi:hypothetical protein PCG10_007829 [Penicillium crustosum]|uniref:Uncharacterized protein n=1 Tax=Penicillium crustosum TaxID=36656 RepID=A0A9P5GJ79_PENCR|nr:uncharacterized protein N7487_009479 [Penicillium crustosum]KAF7521885.1 hypothetical protein PCG10_007829 [Penicillium crustosum]KAJ5395176.1 hypothetical protein N7487_009479 [Penicillium crustosum]